MAALLLQWKKGIALQNKNITSIRVNNERLGLPAIRELTINGIVPLHFLLSWGAEAADLDLHLTGPKGNNERFHIFYLNRGDLDNEPKALFIEDCISTNCSEIIRVDNFKKGDVYRASVFNFGNQSQTSNELSTTPDVELKLISGGEIVYKEGDTDLGVDIIGGKVIFEGSPPTNKIGNTWKAIEINPDSNTIKAVNQITNSENSRAVE